MKPSKQTKPKPVVIVPIADQIKTKPAGSMLCVDIAKLSAVYYHAKNLRKIKTWESATPGKRDVWLGEFL